MVGSVRLNGPGIGTFSHLLASSPIGCVLCKEHKSTICHVLQSKMHIFFNYTLCRGVPLRGTLISEVRYSMHSIN